MRKIIIISLLCVSHIVIGMEQNLKVDIAELKEATEDAAKLKKIIAEYAAQEKAIDAYLQKHKDIRPIETRFQQCSDEQRRQIIRGKIIIELLVMDDNGHLVEREKQDYDVDGDNFYTSFPPSLEYSYSLSLQLQRSFSPKDLKLILYDHK